jgi:hypothetical protein
MKIVMHLPEFTAVGMLGFARWIKGQYGSDFGTAQRLRPGALQPPPKLEMGSQRQNHTPPDRPSDTHCSRDNRPGGPLTGTGGVHLRNAKLWRSPLRHSAPRSTATTQGQRDSDTCPCCPVSQRQVYIPRAGPASLTAVETTGPAEYNPG